MSAPGPILREIHRFHKNIKDLKTRIRQGPRQLETQKTRLANEEAVLAKEKETIKELKVTIHEKEVSISSNNQLMKRYQKQLQESSGQKEFNALRTEIDTTLNKNKQLEEEVFELMEEVEERTAKLPELEKATQKVRDEVAEFERKYNERMENFAKQLEEAEQNLTEAVGKLMGDAREHYQRLIKIHGADTIAAIEDGNCSMCYTALTAQNESDLIRGRLLLCKSCGRILFAPE